MRDERRFTAQRIGRLVARDPARGIRKQDVVAEIGVREWRQCWGLAYGLGLIDFVGDFVVAPALPGPSRPGAKQEARTTCTQTSVRDRLFLSASMTRTEGIRNVSTSSRDTGSHRLRGGQPGARHRARQPVHPRNRDMAAQVLPRALLPDVHHPQVRQPARRLHAPRRLRPPADRHVEARNRRRPVHLVRAASRHIPDLHLRHPRDRIMKRARELEGQTAMFGQLDLFNDTSAGPLEGPAGTLELEGPAGTLELEGGTDGSR